MGKYPRIEAALFDQPWAIMPSKMEAIIEALAARLDGQLDAGLDSYEPGGSARPYDVDRGIRVIPVRGVTSKRMNLFTAISGGTSTDVLQAALKEALEDRAVKGILLDVDSPGGTLDGGYTFAEMIYEARGQRPIVAFVDGLSASMGYWISSASSHIIANKTAEVGSIGIVWAHRDMTDADAKRGIKTTIFTAGKYKAVGSPDVPMDEDGREYIQARLDEAYALFIETVARNRGAAKEKVLADMADGRIFLGESALNARLTDAIGERGDALNELARRIEAARSASIFSTIGGTAPPERNKAMAKFEDDVAQVLAGRPEAVEDDERRKIATAVIAQVRDYDAKTGTAPPPEPEQAMVAGTPEKSGAVAADVASIAKQAAHDATVEERDRCNAIRALCAQTRMAANFTADLLEKGTALNEARTLVINAMAARDQALNIAPYQKDTPAMNVDAKAQDNLLAESRRNQGVEKGGSK